MGSMGKILKLQCTRLEMLTLNSSSSDDDDVEKFASFKDFSKACSSDHGHVPRRSRTHRVVVGVLTSSSQDDDVYHFRNTQMIVSKSKKRSSDEEYMISADDHEEESSEKKRPKNVDKRTMAFSRKKTLQVQNYSPSELPQSLKDYISRLNLEAPPVFVAQKILYATDIRRGQNRLLLPEKIMNTDFFNKCVTGIEKKMLKEKEHVEVSLVDNKMHEYHTLKLAKWNMKSSSNYVLITAWSDVVNDNKLEEAVLLKDAKEEIVVVMKDDDKLKSDVVVQVSLPFLLLHGGDKKVTDPSVRELLNEKAISTDKTFKLYPRMWHSLSRGETAENTEIVFSDIIKWLDEKITTGNAKLERELKSDNDILHADSSNKTILID